jgi:hypothetical protein
MALSRLKRLSRTLSSRGIPTDTADNFNPSSPPDGSRKLLNEHLRNHHRSSPKAFVFEHSPAHSATTLHDPEHTPTDLASHTSSDVSDIVQVLMIGDSVITVETHRREDESIEPPVARQRKKSLGLRRVNTAPAAAHCIPLHGSITTIESVHKVRAWSYPLSWKDLDLVCRIRRSADRKEARRGKASCDLTSAREPSNGVDEHNTAPSSPPVMSGACQSSPSHTSRPTDELDISPRTSVCLTAGSNAPTQHSSHRRGSGAEQVKRKDSHIHDTAQTREKATADLKACTRKLSSDERSSGNLTFLLHPIDWVRQYHASVSSNPESGSSSSSGFSPSSPTTRPSQPARRIEEIRVTQTQPAKPRLSLACTRDEMYMDAPLNLPPGFEVPTVGQAGPADWLHRGWEDHYRRSAEASRRACHPLAAARCLPTRGEQMQQYNPGFTYQNGSQTHPVQRAHSTPDPGLRYTQSCDFAVGWKGKGVRSFRCAGGAGVDNAEGRRASSQGACVTTLTLGECTFPKVLEQTTT